MSYNYRLCVVDEKQALFHRWFEKEKAILHLPPTTTMLRKNEIITDYNRKGIVPFDCGLEKIKALFGVVEFEDGTIKEIEPEKIEFRDGEIIFSNLIKSNRGQISGAQRDIIDEFHSADKSGPKRY